MDSNKKYYRLYCYLVNLDKKQNIITFEEIEKIIEGKLPESAYKYSAWWANEMKTHLHSKAWLDAGYKTSSVKLGISICFDRQEL